MNGIILSAGEGLRMQPITGIIPKPLLPIVNVPLIQWHIARMRECGVQDIGVNLFHRSEMLEDFLKDYRDIQSAKEPRLRGTGGGLLNFRSLFHDDVMVHSCDVVFDRIIQAMVDFHRNQRRTATLLLFKHDSKVQFELGRDDAIQNIHHVAGQGDRAGSENDFYDYAGVSIFSPSAAALFPEDEIFSFVTLLESIKAHGGTLAGYPLEMKWFNINSHREYWILHRELLQGTITLPGIQIRSSRYIDDTSTVETNDLDGFVCVGANCLVSREVALRDTIVFADTQIHEGHFSNCLVSEHFCLTVDEEEGH